MRRGLGRTLLLAVVIAGLAAGYLVFLAPPSVPANAAMLPIARTTMTGAIAPDMASEDGAEVPPASPNGQACLDRIERSSGWADVCWQAYREPADSDPQKDYYWLRIYGSYQPSGAAGIRWLVVKSRLVDPPLFDTYDGWPAGTYDGPCAPQPISLILTLSSAETATICGHITAGPDQPRGWSSTWTCNPCRLFDTDTRAIALYGLAAVKPGVVPAWDVYLDFGT
jgi:hypothetical protein